MSVVEIAYSRRRLWHHWRRVVSVLESKDVAMQIEQRKSKRWSTTQAQKLLKVKTSVNYSKRSHNFLILLLFSSYTWKCQQTPDERIDYSSQWTFHIIMFYRGSLFRVDILSTCAAYRSIDFQITNYRGSNFLLLFPITSLA